MKLGQWLRQENISVYKFSTMLRSGARSAARRYLLPVDHPEFRSPRPKTIQQIAVLTSGAVVLADWFDEWGRPVSQAWAPEDAEAAASATEAAA